MPQYFKVVRPDFWSINGQVRYKVGEITTAKEPWDPTSCDTGGGLYYRTFDQIMPDIKDIDHIILLVEPIGPQVCAEYRCSSKVKVYKAHSLKVLGACSVEEFLNNLTVEEMQQMITLSYREDVANQFVSLVHSDEKKKVLYAKLGPKRYRY